MAQRSLPSSSTKGLGWSSKRPIERSRSASLRRNSVALDGLEWIEADFGQRGVAEQEITRLLRRAGRLDVLVNNNARLHRRSGGEPFVDMDDAEIDAIVESSSLSFSGRRVPRFGTCVQRDVGGS